MIWSWVGKGGGRRVVRETGRIRGKVILPGSLFVPLKAGEVVPLSKAERKDWRDLAREQTTALNTIYHTLSCLSENIVELCKMPK